MTSQPSRTVVVVGEQFEIRQTDDGRWQARSLHPGSPRVWCKARSLSFALIKARKSPAAFSSAEQFGRAVHQAEKEIRST